MSDNKETVRKYMAAFSQLDHAAVRDCLTDDVEWLIPGLFQIRGKEAFDREIENPAFVGRPMIGLTRLTEEADVVVAEGNVQCTKRDGSILNLVFCDVFEMQGGKVKRLISYLMEIKA